MQDKAKISEIFLSYQGEGPYTGSRQLFVRFYGCNLKCVFCDTPLESYKSFSAEELLEKVLDLEDNYNELALTGGEPLLHADFLGEFLPLFRKRAPQKVYLETNGTLPSELKKVAALTDVIAMDLKLPSSTGSKEGLWDVHRRFVETAAGKELIAKIIVTGNTDVDDMKRASDVIKDSAGDVTVVIQPVTPDGEEVSEPDSEMMEFFRKMLEKDTGKEVFTLGQAHKRLGIR